MTIVRNPFAHRGMITNPADFIGRREQLDRIVTLLYALQNISVVGEPCIGKSALLYNLAQTGGERLGDANYQFFYLDLQEARCHTAAGFLTSILTELGVGTDGIKPEYGLNRNLIAFSQQLEAVRQAGKRVVLCLDEFEIVFKHPQEFTGSFFDNLRAQLNARRLMLVTATHRRLQALSLEGRLTSPFHNVFIVVPLEEFTEAEAREFVAFHKEKVNFTDAELKFIFSYLDPHPLRLQILCDFVLENRRRGLADWALRKEIVREYGNYFVGRFDTKQLHKAKRARSVFSLDNIKKFFETLRGGKSLISGSDKADSDK